MKFFYKTLILSTTFFSASLSFAFCPKISEQNFNYKALRSTIENCNLNTVGAVVGVLPDSYRSNFTFVYESKAEEEKLNPGTVTPVFPRAILFGGNGKTVLSFTTNPTMPSFQHIQLFEHVKGEGLKFKSIKLFAKKAVFDENPTSCKTCHGSPSKPIWTEYNRWPGVYGSHDDGMDPKSVERAYFYEFAKQQRESPLPRLSKLTNFKYYLSKNLAEENTVSEGKYTNARPNLFLSHLLMALQAKVLAERFRISPFHDVLNEALLIKLYRCDQSQDDFATFLPYYVRHLNRGVQGLKQKFKIEDFNRDIFNLLMKTGIYEVGDFSLDQEIRTVPNPDPFSYPKRIPRYAGLATDYFGIDGFKRARPNLYLGEFIEALWHSYDYLNWYANEHQSDTYSSFPYPYNGYGIPSTLDKMELFLIGPTRLNLASHNEACSVYRKSAVLKAKNEKELYGELHEPKPQVNSSPPQGAKNPFASCIYCHQDNSRTELNFPFENLGNLKKLLSNNAALKKRIEHNVVSNKMPLTTTLTENGKTAILDFLKQIK